MNNYSPAQNAFSSPGTAPSNNSKPIFACDGQGFKQLLNSSLKWLELHTDHVNSLNVFPVPDGDTGINMYLTLQAACQEIAGSPAQEVGTVAHLASRGALMGARGNSGVILSQILRGLAQGLEGKEDFSATEFAQALKRGSEVAYKAVIKPVEGTILTVIRESSDAAFQAAPQLSDLRDLLEYVVHEARDSVSRTPSLLPILREAGVVDAGGQGLFVILEGMSRYAHGDVVPTTQALDRSVDLHTNTHFEQEYGYDVQYVISGTNLDVAQIREDISAMGDCPLVVGDNTTIKVHVHTPSPGDPLNYGARAGSLSRVIVENMQEQYQEFIMGRASPLVPTTAREEKLDIAIVAVSPGPGLSRVFESLGVSVIVPGGQTMNPSIEQLLDAAEKAPSDQVIILPNNSNIILAAQQAQALAEKRVRVVPTKSVPQGISAMLAYNYTMDLDANTRAMERSADEVCTAQITVAVRDARIDDLQVREGQLIGLLDGKLIVTGTEIEVLALVLFEQIDMDEIEVVTLYFGEDVTTAQAQNLAARLQETFPEVEFEVIDGGQPHYHYIISAE
ncbi:MAG: DAK2 domain-containing protein [Anaerolineae bacterium]|nr:DAK2 domain-containing protein [Anaerolineae bacterium]